VLRMLGAQIPNKNQLPLFGKGTGRPNKPRIEARPSFCLIEDTDSA
jgi:hypothetical protein